MDRTAWIVIALCVIGLVGWEVYVTKTIQTRPAPSAQITPAPGATTPGSSTSPAPSGSAAPAESVAPAPPKQPDGAASFEEKTETLGNSDVELRFTNRGGAIQEAVLLNNLAERGERIVLNAGNTSPIGALVDDPAAPQLLEFALAKDADGRMKCERAESDGIVVRKHFAFTKTEAKDNYILEISLDFRNDGAQPYKKGNYFVTLGSAQPVHSGDWPTYTRIAWSINGDFSNSDLSVFEGSGGFLGIGSRAAQKTFQQSLNKAQWVAVTNQFFTTLFAPLDDKPIEAWAQRFEVTREGQSQDKKLYGINGAMGMPGFELPPNSTKTVRFQVYIGPKIYHRLAKLEHDEAGIVDFGVFLGLGFIKIVSQFLLNLLNLIHGMVHDYGSSILILTVLVKGVLWPIQNKANYSMRRMALLSPKIQELREKYKEDPTKMNQEVMKLYKDYGVNPVSGCLPMLIQIPIFFGLFSMLQQAVELRDAKFLWVKDLSQPDTIAHLPLVGWPINIIPLCMAATQIWLMAMTPKTGDPTQRRVMMFTPLIFLFICYNFAAALALYYTAQNLLSILQFYQNKRQPAPTLEKIAASKRKR